MENNSKKGSFQTNFGFIMAALGSAVGLGNLWGFPYKLGKGGGFGFLVIYLIMCVVIGFPLVLSEISLGRKTKKAAIEAYEDAHKSFKFNGVLQTIVPWFLIAFYCTFGGYVLKFLFLSIADLGGTGVLSTNEPIQNFVDLITPDKFGGNFLWVAIFLAMTIVIVMGGVSGGIERFCKIAMPALFVMLVLVVIRSCTLPGASEGLKFLFKPNFEGWSTPKDFLNILATAGGQMFFSLSLSSGCLIVYGSYVGKEHNLEKDAMIITAGDTLIALLAGLAIMPAVFAFDMDPGSGPLLLFVTMTAVFHSMGGIGLIFQLVFWLLVFFAVLSSSIGMMEGGIAAIMDANIKKGKPVNRIRVTLIMGAVALLGNFLTAYDCLGANEKTTWMWSFLGEGKSVLDLWDTIGELILMPLTGLILAIMLGWVVPHFVDDEIELSGDGGVFKTKKFYNFCIKWVGPVFMIFIVITSILPVIRNMIG